MSTDPAVSGKDAAQALRKLGFREDRVEGSHHIFVKDELPHVVVVPVHGARTLPSGTLRSIIRAAGLSKKQFFAALP
ncbi:MAG: type II toxin-antitoxin system HicA family toxin [Acidobacteria bacterium]|nr:type II toxin-antitoxin system HicA family toxin [Acidobacteriota bacterium]